MIGTIANVRPHALTWARCASVALCLACTVMRAGAASDAIRIIVGGIEKQIYLPAPLAARLGYFREKALDEQLLSDSSGVHAEDALLTGAAQGVVGFYDHTIDLQARGKFVQCVVQFSRAPGETEVVATRLADVILTPADFKGHTLGVTGLGSSTHFLTQYLAAIHGVKSGDMRIVAAGSGMGFVNAMREGRIDAGMATEPTISRLLQAGDARVLVDLRTPASTQAVLGGLYPGACLYMTTQWVNTHRPQVQRLVNAIVKALRFIDRHSAQDIAKQVPPEYFLGDEGLYVSALRDSKSMFLADGVMPPTGPATALKILKLVSRSVQHNSIDLSRTYTTEFTSAVH